MPTQIFALDKLDSMDNSTFRLRLVQLMKKSRKALRLYSSVGVVGGAAGSLAGNLGTESLRAGMGGSGPSDRGLQRSSTELSELQVAEWRDVNSELLRALSATASVVALRRVINEVVVLRDRFHAEWRSLESRVYQDQRALIDAATHGDFIRAALLGRTLVACKARMQACHAAYEELQDLASFSKGSQEEESVQEKNIKSGGQAEHGFKEYGRAIFPSMTAASPVRLSTFELDREQSLEGSKYAASEFTPGSESTTGSEPTTGSESNPFTANPNPVAAGVNASGAGFTGAKILPLRRRG